MNRPLLLLILTSLGCAGLHAQGASTSATSLLLPFTAEAAALTDANIAISGSLSSVSANPATIAGVAANEFRFTFVQWIEDVQSQALVAVLPTSQFTLALAVATTSVSGIEVRDIPGPAIGSFTSHAVSLRATAAGRLTEEIEAGVTLKYLYEKIYVDDATGFAFDAGVTSDVLGGGWHLGAAVTNFGSLGAFRSTSSDLPTALRFGVSRTIEAFGLDWTGHAALSRETHDGENHLHAALEASYGGLVVARVGYVTGYEARSLSAGIGFRYGPARLDYAVVPFSLGFNAAQCLSVGVTF